MSLFDAVINATDAEAPAYRQAPEGNYLVTVRSARKVKANSGTEGIELQFTMIENLDPNADMSEVTLSKARLRDTMWVTENTFDRVKRDLARISPETVGNSITDALDILPGAEVVVRVDHLTTDRNGKALNTPWLEVGAYYSKEWFFANRLKAA